MLCISVDILFQPSHPAETDDSIFPDADELPFFIKCSTHEALPMGYHLATLQDVEKNREALLAAMPGWEIACLADGWVDGTCYGGRSGLWDNNKHSHLPSDLGHKGAVLCSQCRSCMVATMNGGDPELTTMMELITQILRKKYLTGNSPIHHLSASDSSSNRSSTSNLPTGHSINSSYSVQYHTASSFL